MSAIVCQSCDDLLRHDSAKGTPMAVSTVNLTPTTQQEALRQQCEALAATFAQRALDYDRAGQFPVENFADLRRQGLLGLTIPSELGGLGETYFGFALVVEEIARGCASTGLCFTMHCACVALVHHASPAQQQHLARTVVDDGALWTLAFTESGSGSHFLCSHRRRPVRSMAAISSMASRRS
jgi:alkylation response protein AidB-like acyl-CoA dehydrogenase